MGGSTRDVKLDKKDKRNREGRKQHQKSEEIEGIKNSRMDLFNLGIRKTFSEDDSYRETVE